MYKKDPYSEKRRAAALTTKEFLTFVCFPFYRNQGFLNNYEFNNQEDDRFIRYGFEKKWKQAKVARTYGIIIYISIVVIITTIQILN